MSESLFCRCKTHGGIYCSTRTTAQSWSSPFSSPSCSSGQVILHDSHGLAIPVCTPVKPMCIMHVGQDSVVGYSCEASWCGRVHALSVYLSRRMQASTVSCSMPPSSSRPSAPTEPCWPLSSLALSTLAQPLLQSSSWTGLVARFVPVLHIESDLVLSFCIAACSHECSSMSNIMCRIILCGTLDMLGLCHSCGDEKHSDMGGFVRSRCSWRVEPR